MYYDYNKRSYLLPPGCKDLIDLLRLEEQKKRASIQLPFSKGEIFAAGSAEALSPWKLKKKKDSQDPPTILPLREVIIPAEILVRELADIAGQKPYKIIADLMEIGIFASVKQAVQFDAASRILKKYGITAKRAA